MEKTTIENESIIFTTGAFLKPVKTHLNGKELWMWVVTEFIDDSFKDGEVYNPNEFAETQNELFIDTTKDMGI